MRQVEELAVPAGAGELPPGRGGDRRVVRLQGADRGDVDPLDAAADGPLAQVRGERLHLWQLGHACNGSVSVSRMKVVVAHNRYRSAQPSGENTIVDQEIAQLRRGRRATVLPFLRDSDDIDDLPPAQQGAAAGLADLRPPAPSASCAGLLRRAPPGRAAPAQPVPAAVALGGAHRAPARRAGGADGAQLPPGLRAGPVLPRRAHLHRLPGPGVGLPGVVHRCYRGSRAQSAVMAATLAVHRPTWRSVDRYIALTDGDRRPSARLRHPGRPDRGQAELGARPGSAGAARRRASSSSAGSPRRRASACCSTPGRGTRTARSGRCGSPATASSAALAEAGRRGPAPT